MKENGKVYPDNETVVAQVNNGESAIGPINHYYWYRLREEQGKDGMHSTPSAVPAGRPGEPDQRLRRGCPALERQTGRRPEAARLPGQRGRTARAGAAATAGSTRCAPGSPRHPGLPPLSSFGTSSLTPAQLGNGREALELEQKVGSPVTG